MKWVTFGGFGNPTSDKSDHKYKRIQDSLEHQV